jgi:hypothetical protein
MRSPKQPNPEKPVIVWRESKDYIETKEGPWVRTEPKPLSKKAAKRAAK